jgi:hypothetical protein
MLRIQNLTHVYPNGTRALDDVARSAAGMFGSGRTAREVDVDALCRDVAGPDVRHDPFADIDVSRS